MIEELEYLNAPVLAISVIVILAIAVGVLELLNKIWDFIAPKIFKIKTKTSRRKELDNLVLSNQEEIKQLREDQKEDRKYSKQADREIKQEVSDLKSSIDTCAQVITQMRIEQMRKTILDFADIAADDNKYPSKEKYNDIEITYTTYEELLKANKLTNGQAELSMQIIRDSYKKRIRNHTFLEDKMREIEIEDE